MAEVILKNINKIYENGFQAVRDVSLEIEDKEFMVIVGPSGCGKSTTLRMIAGLEEISSGELCINGKRVNDIPPKNRDIAMVFQNYALYPHMTVFQNMAFALKLRKVDKKTIEQIVNRTAQMLGISELLEIKPKYLSGGQRQRVALGRAIVRQPAAFLFDEPLSNLDAKLRVTTRAELKALHLKLATTSIYVTHDQVEAMTLGDRICVMYDGCIQQVDTPINVYNYPVNRFVAGFLGTPPMNFLKGNIARIDDELCFKTKSDCIRIKRHDKISKYEGKSVVLGIRPEHIYISPLPDSSPIKATVEIVEALGDKLDVYFNTLDGDRVIGSIEPHILLKPGQKVDLYLDEKNICFFEDEVNGKNILI